MDNVPPVTPRVEIALDCCDVSGTSTFWSTLLGYHAAEPMDEVYWAATDPRGVRPRLVFQKVHAMPEVKSAVHLDIHVEDLDEMARSVERLGGRRLDAHPIIEAGSTWVRCADPEGTVFCLVLAR